MGKTLNYTAISLLSPILIPLLLVLFIIVIVVLVLLAVLYPVFLVVRKTHGWFSSSCKPRILMPRDPTSGPSTSEVDQVAKNSQQSAAVSVASQLPCYEEAETTRVLVLPSYNDVLQETDANKHGTVLQSVRSTPYKSESV